MFLPKYIDIWLIWYQTSLSICRCEVFSLTCTCGKNLFSTWNESFFRVHFSFGSIEEDSPNSPFHRDIWSLTRPVGESGNLCPLGSTLVLLSIPTLPTQSCFARMSWLTRDFTLKGNVFKMIFQTWVFRVVNSLTQNIFLKCNNMWGELRVAKTIPKHLEFLSTWCSKKALELGVL